MLICGKCKEIKPEEEFYKNKSKKNGYGDWCIDCQKLQNKEYYKKNKEKIIKRTKERWEKLDKEELALYSKEYKKNNEETIKILQSKYRAKNKDKASQYQKEYYKKNKEKILINIREYYKNNEEQIKQWYKNYCKENAVTIKTYRKEYAKNNSDVYKRAWHKRRTLEKKLPSTLTTKQWEMIKQDFHNSCAYCGVSEQEVITSQNESLNQEHFIPLSKGGCYSHNNIIPSCKRCNSSKGTISFFEWYPVYQYYNKEREEFILEYLNYNKDKQQLSIL